MARWAILLLTPPEPDPEVWNRRLVDLCCELAEAVGVEELVLHLRDAEARATPAQRVTGQAGFHALVEVAGEERARPAVDALAGLGPPHVYAVESRRVKAYPRSWPDTTRTPGVELISAVRRAPAIDAAAFDAHWRDRHAPLALRHHPGMWEYRQLVVRATLTPGSPDFDGLAVIGFPTHADLRDRLYDSPAGQAIIEEDIARFIDLPRCEATFTGEYVLKS
jgi:uncharacterized protein (TIGR02118 family)